jgi:hypothetical protein
MTNSTDLFQPEHEQLALPAQRVIVLIDGIACEDVAPVEIVRSGWPDFNRVRLSCVPQGHDLRAQMEDRFSSGAPVLIRQFYDANPPQQTPRALTIFAGHIESVETTVDDKAERLEIVARDASAILERVTVYGQRIAKSDGSAVLLPGLQTAFNPNGQGNAAARPIDRDAKTYVPFSSSPTESRMWTCAQAIAYLLCEYLPGGLVRWPGVGQLEALTENHQPRDLDVTGLTLLEAIHRCAEGADLVFRFVPHLAENPPVQSLVFCRNAGARCTELNAQPSSQPLSVARTDIAAVHSTRPFHPVTHRTIGQGDFKVHEATFELVKAWDPSLEGTNYMNFSASTNADFGQVRDVYRKWCLNEAGDYTSSPFDRGEAFDFSGLFGTSDYAQRRRRFWPSLSQDSQGRSLGYYLEVSFDNGAYWWQYLNPFNNLLDECGIWLSGDQLDVDTWVAALKGVLRFRITASVISDERLSCTVADGPIGSTVPVVDHLLTLPSRFQYRRVSPGSILRQAGYSSDEVDDTPALFDLVRRQAARSSPVVETLQAQTPSLRLHLHPGDQVTSGPDSRDWLGCRRDNRSVARIEEVRLDFRRQYTNLTIIRQRQ